MNKTNDIIKTLAHIADVHEDGEGYRINNYAPDSSEYDGTEHGGEWDEECDALLAEVREALPAGWVAEWSDNDVAITAAITDAQIKALRREAQLAGDSTMADMCCTALRGEASALGHCEHVIKAARAMCDDD